MITDSKVRKREVMEHSQVRSCVVSGGLEHDEVMEPVEGDHEELLILQANAPVTHLYCCGLIIISETINNINNYTLQLIFSMLC